MPDETFAHLSIYLTFHFFLDPVLLIERVFQRTGEQFSRTHKVVR